MLNDIQDELDEVVKLVKVDLNNEALAKLRPDLYMALFHALEKKEFMARSSVSTHKDDLLLLSLERFT